MKKYNTKTKKSNIKGVFTSTIAATMLLANGLPVLHSQASASASELPNIPMLPTLSAPSSQIINGEYVVTFKEGTPISTMQSDIEQYGGEIIEENFTSFLLTVRLTNKQYENMKNDTDVEIIEENVTFSTQAYGPITQYSHQMTQVQSAWDSNLSGEGIEIAILDTGIANHTDLNVSGGVSTVNYTTSYSDDNGHGTHVAGVVASKNNGEGTTGVAHESKIYSVKVLNQNGRGELMDIIEGIQWAIDQGVDIINVSLGTNVDSQSLKSTIDLAEQRGILVVAAVGNSGDTNIMYPALYDNVIAVGATNQNNSIASFSSRGEAIDIVAPGQGVVSTYLGNMYAGGNGTSQAAPYIAGMLALLKEQNPNKSANELTLMLYSTAKDLGGSGKDSIYGHGLVQFPSMTKEEAPVEEIPVEEPIIEEETTEDTAPVVEEEPTKIEETIEETTPSANVTLNTTNTEISWADFANTERYRVEMELKDASGEYKSYSYARTVVERTFKLDALKIDGQYKLNIVPRIGYKYDDSKEVTIYVSNVNGVEISDNEITTPAVEEKQTISKTPISNETSVAPKTETEINELPEGVTFDSKLNTLYWENIGTANQYKVKMEQKQSNGEYKKFSYDRSSKVLEFKLDILDKGYDYKLTIVPRFSFKYDETKAIKLYVSLKDGKIVMSKEDTTVTREEIAAAVTPTIQNAETPTGISFNKDNNVLSWDKITSAKKYRVEMKQKNSSGKYVNYSFARSMTVTKFDLDVLAKNKEYQITIVPQIGWKYDYTKAYTFYVNNKGEFSIKSVD